MIDQHEARFWVEQHKAFSAWTHSMAREINAAFRVLARIRYDQPWRSGRPARVTAPVRPRPGRI